MGSLLPHCAGNVAAPPEPLGGAAEIYKKTSRNNVVPGRFFNVFIGSRRGAGHGLRHGSRGPFSRAGDAYAPQTLSDNRAMKPSIFLRLSSCGLMP